MPFPNTRAVHCRGAVHLIAPIAGTAAVRLANLSTKPIPNTGTIFTPGWGPLLVRLTVTIIEAYLLYAVQTYRGLCLVRINPHLASISCLAIQSKRACRLLEILGQCIPLLILGFALRDSFHMPRSESGREFAFPRIKTIPITVPEICRSLPKRA